jgi:hypothetical protein
LEAPEAGRIAAVRGGGSSETRDSQWTAWWATRRIVELSDDIAQRVLR